MKLEALLRLVPVRWPRWLRVTGGAIVFAAFAATLLDNWRQLTALSWDLEVPPLALSAGLLLITYFLGILGWHRIVTGLGGPCTLEQSARVWLYSNLARYLPGSMWYAVGRAILGHDAGVSPATGTVGVVFEIIYLVISHVVVVVAMWPFWASHTLPALPWFLPAALIGTALIVVRPGFLARLASFGTGSDSTIRNTKYVVRMPTGVCLQLRDSLEILTIYVAQALLTGVAFYFLARALAPLPLSLMPFSAGVFALAWLIGFVSFFAPGGLGVREGVLAYLLSPIVTGPMAIIIAILARVWLMAGELLCVGFVFVVKDDGSIAEGTDPTAKGRELWRE